MTADIGSLVGVERAFRRRDFIIGILRIPHTKAVMMLCGEQHVLKFGIFCRFRPVFGTETDGIKGFNQIMVFLIELGAGQVFVNVVPCPGVIFIGQRSGFHNAPL